MLESYFQSEREKNFVQREVDRIRLANFVNDIIHANTEYPHSAISDFDYEHIENLLEPIEYTKEDYKEWLRENHIEDDTTYNELKDMLSEYQDDVNDSSEVNYIKYSNYFINFIDELEENREYQEIFQWFMVDSYQYEKLLEIGEPVLYAGGAYFWGRTCCGQAIELDGTFQKIYRMIKKG